MAGSLDIGPSGESGCPAITREKPSLPCVVLHHRLTSFLGSLGPMEPIRVRHLLPSLQGYLDISLDQLFLFATLTARLKDDIILAQPASISPRNPPQVLPHSVIQFL